MFHRGFLFLSFKVEVIKDKKIRNSSEELLVDYLGSLKILSCCFPLPLSSFLGRASSNISAPGLSLL